MGLTRLYSLSNGSPPGPSWTDRWVHVYLTFMAEKEIQCQSTALFSWLNKCRFEIVGFFCPENNILFALPLFLISIVFSLGFFFAKSSQLLPANVFSVSRYTRVHLIIKSYIIMNLLWHSLRGRDRDVCQSAAEQTFNMGSFSMDFPSVLALILLKNLKRNVETLERDAFQVLQLYIPDGKVSWRLIKGISSVECASPLYCRICGTQVLSRYYQL